eukprot:TRINITY_DN24672_c0_g1_i1.p1 TRINITY_DN24672_c0_g1~~TRINITY_DN24672_c0_g1_i1.p1  ORF type:complete len:168 (-),score=14.65 TRINITY_DN24672_c0_g1_i1:103-606(-)
MVSKVKQKAPRAKILLTGYCTPAGPGGRRLGDCETPSSLMADSMAAMRQVASADPASITFVDSTAACNGSLTSWSPKAYFVDPIHLNNRGYCKLWSQTAIQTALGCDAQVINCDNEPCETEGIDGNCGDGEMKSCPSCCSYSGITDATAGLGMLTPFFSALLSLVLL